MSSKAFTYSFNITFEETDRLVEFIGKSTFSHNSKIVVLNMNQNTIDTTTSDVVTCWGVKLAFTQDELYGLCECLHQCNPFVTKNGIRLETSMDEGVDMEGNNNTYYCDTLNIITNHFGCTMNLAHFQAFVEFTLNMMSI